MTTSQLVAGNTAFVKTTGEEVFVLKVVNLDTEATEYPALVPQRAIVRRPVLTQNGVMHMVESFFVDELETEQQRHNRQASVVGDIIQSVRNEVGDRLQESRAMQLADIIQKSNKPVA